MASGIAQVHCRRHKGKMEVQAFGQTNTRQKYLKKQKELAASSPADKNFKSELATAVEELLG